MNLKAQIRTSDAKDGIRVTQKHKVIKVGIDWHAKQYTVVRIIDEGSPEAARRFSPEAFLRWMSEQFALAEKVHTCYEAGAGGFALHRQITALGAINYVITPRDLDRDYKGIKNDAKDARQLALDLDRYVRGNKESMRVVYVPTPEEEQRRQPARQRRQLRDQRLSLAAQGRLLLLGQGIQMSNDWWRFPGWISLREKLPQWLVDALEIFRRVIVIVDQEARSLKKNIEKAAPSERPRGMGPLTFEELDREVCDWNRFKNRKKTGGYAGLTGGVFGSDDRSLDLSITKSGNARIRAILIEMAWRWVGYQKESKLVARWGAILLKPGAHPRARKRAIVAVARQIFVDIWRWRTGRASPKDLGWVMMN